MKMTIDLPDDVVRAVQQRANEEVRVFEDLVVELLILGLELPVSNSDRSTEKVALPIFRSSHPAKPDEEITPERIHEILLQQEVDRALGR